jgi:hypothetical protein
MVPPYSSPVTLLQYAFHVLGVVFFDQMPYKKIPVSDHNLHKNIFWRKWGQSLVGDTMKRQKWFLQVVAADSAEMGQKWLYRQW